MLFLILSVTGPYVRRIFLEELKASPDCAVNIVPLEDFGGKSLYHRFTGNKDNKSSLGNLESLHNLLACGVGAGEPRIVYWCPKKVQVALDKSSIIAAPFDGRCRFIWEYGMYLSIYLFVCACVCVSVCLSVYLPVSVCLYVCLSVSVCLSVYHH